MASGITENDVWKAADALLLEGLRPTIERVRRTVAAELASHTTQVMDESALK